MKKLTAYVFFIGIALLSCKKETFKNDIDCLPDILTIDTLTNETGIIMKRHAVNEFAIFWKDKYNHQWALVSCNLPEEYKHQNLHVRFDGWLKRTIDPCFDYDCVVQFVIIRITK